MCRSTWMSPLSSTPLLWCVHVRAVDVSIYVDVASLIHTTPSVRAREGCWWVEQRGCRLSHPWLNTILISCRIYCAHRHPSAAGGSHHRISAATRAEATFLAVEFDALLHCRPAGADVLLSCRL